VKQRWNVRRLSLELKCELKPVYGIRARPAPRWWQLIRKWEIRQTWKADKKYTDAVLTPEWEDFDDWWYDLTGYRPTVETIYFRRNFEAPPKSLP
jgi:hypothetical protein